MLLIKRCTLAEVFFCVLFLSFLGELAAQGIVEPSAKRKSPNRISQVGKSEDLSYPVCLNPKLSDPDLDGWGWENSKTCRTKFGRAKTSSKERTKNFHSASRLLNSASDFGIIYENDFEDSKLGPYTKEDVSRDWNSPSYIRGFRSGKTNIVDDGGSQGNVLKVSYLKGQSGFQTSSGFPMKLPKSLDQVYLAFDIKFAPGFDRVAGGKLPGMCGGVCNSGLNKPSGYDGWSVRSLWQSESGFASYVYHAAQRNRFGDIKPWRWDDHSEDWHRVQYNIRLNKVGLKNGLLEIWLDGKIVLMLNNIEFRRDIKLGIDTFYFSTFFGGKGKNWAPKEDTYILFDNFIISSQAIY